MRATFASRSTRSVRVVGAVLLALLGTSVVIASQGVNPFDAFAVLLRTPLASSFGLAKTLTQASVLICLALAVAIPGNGRLWNIGGEGQMFIGAFFSAVIALSLAGPGVLTRIAALLAGALGGALWAAIAGYLRARFGANEVLTTLMMNYIAILLVEYYISMASRSSGIPDATPRIAEGVLLPHLSPHLRASTGIVIAVAMAVLFWWLLDNTRTGLQIRAIGVNDNAAQNLGIGVPRVQVLSLALGGAMAGLAGSIVVIGIQGLLIRGFSPGFGFIGIAIAMLARLKPKWIIPAGLLFSALTVGGDSLQPTVGLSSHVAVIIQSLVILLLLGLWAIRPQELGAAR